MPWSRILAVCLRLIDPVAAASRSMAKGFNHEELDRRGATLLRGVWAVADGQHSLLRMPVEECIRSAIQIATSQCCLH